MEVTAKLTRLRMSPRKVRLIARLISRKNVQAAETQLVFLKQAAAEPVLKLLKSAMANAEHNFKLDKEKLWVKTITVDAGETIKRSRPRAFGRAAPIRKRTSHINLVLTDDPREIKLKRTYKPRTRRQKLEDRSQKLETGNQETNQTSNSQPQDSKE